MISETIQNNDINGITRTKRRFLYIDLIKAWAILCVVMGHLLIFNFYSVGDDSILFGLIYSFHLPLFAFASGLVTNVSKFCLTKRIKILVPLLGCGLPYTYVIGKDLSFFLYDDMKCGYWWLWVMAIFYVCLYVIKITRVKQIVGLCMIEALFVLLNHSLPIDVKNICCIASCTGLWPWLCLGILFNQKTDYLLGNHNNFGMVAIGIFWLLTFWTNLTIPIKGLHYLVSLFAVLFFVWLFYLLDKKQYAITNNLGGQIGQFSLQIYVLHYWIIKFLPLQAIGNYLELNHLRILDYIICPTIALSVCYLCILLSKLLQRMHLGWIFGR